MRFEVFYNFWVFFVSFDKHLHIHIRLALAFGVYTCMNVAVMINLLSCDEDDDEWNGSKKKINELRTDCFFCGSYK